MIRHYQAAALRAALAAVRAGERAGLWILPTGTGKTFAFVELAALLGLPALVLVHREALIRQTIAHVRRQWFGARCGVVKADRDEWDADCVVASVPSLTPARLARVRPDHFGLVVADECHHAPAASWSRAINHFADRVFLLGVTATPDRLDGKGLADWFGPSVLYEYGLVEAVREQYLVPPRQYAVRTDVRLDDVGRSGGDFRPGQLSRAVNRPERNVAVVDAWKEHAAGRRTVAFCVDVEHTVELAAEFERRGVRAAYLHGRMDDDEQRDVLAAHAAGDFAVLANCMILTEGYDDPDVECILWARPTLSRSLYTQGTGRGLRLPKNNPGKRDLLVLDVVDNCRKHKLVTACDLFGAEKAQDAAGRPVLDVVDEEHEEEERRQEELQRVRGPVRWRLESVCPWPELPSLDGYAPTMPWQDAAPSDKQVRALSALGLKLSGTLTRGEASWLLDQAMQYDAAFPQPATPKQRWLLRYHGLWQEGITKREAGVLIGRLKRGQNAAAETSSEPAAPDVPLAE